MNLITFRSIFRHYLNAGVTVQLVSAPGLGKSETVEDAVAAFSKEDGFEWGLNIIMGASMTPPDVMGYLIPTMRKMKVLGNGGAEIEQNMPTSEFTLPPTFMSLDGTPMNSYKRGVIFIDEWDKTDPDTKRALAQVLLSGSAGAHRVHEGIGVVTAANRAEDRSGSTKEYDFIINRRAEVTIVPDVNAWEDWAVRRAIDPMYIAFAKRNVEIVFSGKVPDKQGPFCTPRSFVMLASLLAGFQDPRTGTLPLESEKQLTLITEMASGLIGPAAANHFMTWCKLKTELPEFDDIVKNPEKTAVPSKPDGKMMVAYDCAHRITAENADAVVTYCLRLPPDFQLTFGAAAIKRNFRMISHPAFVERFTPANAGLIGLISQ